ncbi:DUF6053 domain-containing protein [Lysobacter enzymogenes]|uniref:DUF6053 domain-containing protein n=1 Tax=Lysobacter enzymogenes TaxID=69 RepID=UPI003D18CD74
MRPPAPPSSTRGWSKSARSPLPPRIEPRRSARGATAVVGGTSVPTLSDPIAANRQESVGTEVPPTVSAAPTPTPP